MNTRLEVEAGPPCINKVLLTNKNQFLFAVDNNTGLNLWNSKAGCDSISYIASVSGKSS